MTILVTGGAGFIGSNLIDQLILEGHKVICLDNFDTFYERSIKEANIFEFSKSDSVEVLEGDIRDRELLGRIFGGNKIDLVIHLAAKAGVRPSISHPHDYYDVNTIGTLAILEAMKKHSVSKMIFASSSSVYGNHTPIPFSEDAIVDAPISPYAATKRSAELMCHVYCMLHKFDISCLRFFTVYGPRQRPDLAIHKFTKLIYEGKAIPFFGDGDTARDYTYIDDVVAGIINAAKFLKGYNVYNIGESKITSLNELLEILSNEMNKKVIVDRLPFQEGDVQVTCADVSKSKREINYNPSIDMPEGIRRFLIWFYAQY
jgi:UDP-glucuronate 4-epimerase